MARRLGLKAASDATGLSTWELRTGALSGKYPHMRVGGKNGRYLFDLDLLEERIKQLMQEDVKEQDSVPDDYGKLRKIY